MKLVEELALGRRSANHVAGSRVMFGPIETNLGRNRGFSAEHVAFYERRAKGGAGIVVTEIASVHESDWPYERAPLAANCEPGWRAVADAIRAAAPTCVVLAGLGHSGGQGTSHWSQGVLWAPSPVPEVATREVPKIMEADDIAAVIRGFASAAKTASNAGLAGVEINIGQFSLVRQFISGLTNMRSDEYGTDRLRFAREVLTAVRTAIGDSALLAIRFSADEMAPWAGITPEMALDIATELVQCCAADLLTLVRGSIYTAAATQPDMHAEPGFNIGLTQGVSEGLQARDVDVRVVAQGSIVDVGQAEWIIETGIADAVEMTRAQLADADLVNRTRAGVAIRPCILCNQTCKVRDNRNPIITCVMDPRTGHELTDAPEPARPLMPVVANPNPNRPQVRIIGGGIAGMETARLLALAGWDPEVHERTNQLGGVLAIAARGSGRARLASAVNWLTSECNALGVRFVLNSAITDGGVDVGGVDSSIPTVVATGGTSGALPFTVHNDARVMHDVDALGCDPSEFVNGTIAVWDPIGGPIAISIAEWLAEQGRSVVLITPDLLVGEKLALTGDLAAAQPRLHGKAVQLVKRATVREVAATGVVIEDRFSAEVSTIDAATFIACGQRLPNTNVDPAEHCIQIGDRVAPRTIHEAMLEARRATQELRRMQPRAAQ